jgi:hypothetical protein
MGSNRKIAGKYKMKPCHIKDHKQRGQWVELLFMARAAQYGLGVAKPLGDWEYYDAAVQHQGRFLSVQVKSVMYRHHRSYTCNVIAGRTHVLYPTNRLDYFAIYIIPLDLWYIVPYSVVGRTNQSICLTPDLKGHKYERYKEAWHLLFRTRSRKRSQKALTMPARNGTLNMHIWKAHKERTF